MRKGQFAMEYLLVVGFSLVLIVPIVGLLYGEYDENRTQVRVEHLSELSRELAFQVEKVYYQGAPSRVMIEAYIPPKTEVFEIIGPDNDGFGGVPVVDGDQNARSLQFVLSSASSTIYADTKVPMEEIRYSGDLSGRHFFIIESDGGSSPQAINDDYVSVRIQGLTADP